MTKSIYSLYSIYIYIITFDYPTLFSISSSDAFLLGRVLQLFLVRKRKKKVPTDFGWENNRTR